MTSTLSRNIIKPDLSGNPAANMKMAVVVAFRDVHLMTMVMKQIMNRINGKVAPRGVYC